MGAQEDYTEVSREQWSGVAEGWERHAESLEDRAPGVAARWMLEGAELSPGDRVLELACGPAGVGLQAVEPVGPDGHVLLTDFSQPMVEVAGRRAAELGNVEARVLDAQRMDLPDESFDAVLCRFGYMLMGDPAAALAETRRVLRSGGRLALAVWGAPDANPWAFGFMRAVMDHFNAPPPEPGAPGMFALADGERLRGLMEGAGLAEVRVETVEGRMPYDSLDHWWEETADLAGPVAALLRNMAPDDREAVRGRLRETADAHPGRDGAIDFPAAITVAAARRP